MLISESRLRRIIREALGDSQSSVFDSFQYIPATNWDEESLRQEYLEEVTFSFENGKEYVSQRWPAIDAYTLEFMTNEDKFIEKASQSPVVNLPIEEIKDIYNHGQLHKIIEMYENGSTPQEVKDFTIDEFSKFRTDPDVEGKTYPKESSYLRWVDKFSEYDEEFDKPPILLSANNQLMHIGGATRQTGALTNKKILPYLILSVEE